MKEDHTAILAIEAMLNSSMKPIRNEQVMTIEDIAKLYEVTPKEILQTVKREPKRFPIDFMFRLTKKEQVILKTNHLYAFTEGGVLMAGGQLRSKRAKQIHMQFISYFLKAYNDFSDKIKIDDPEVADFFALLKEMMRKRK